MERVLVTGLGAVSCLGSGADALWRGLGSGHSAPSKVADPRANFALPIMYRIPDDAVPQEPVRFAGAPLGPTSRLALQAAREAVRDAAPGPQDPSRVAVVVGTAMGDHRLREERRAAWSDGGAEADDDAVEDCTDFAAASAVADELGGHGPVTTVANACAASGYAVAVAADMIRAGEADLALVGGAESYTRVALANFNRMGGIDPERCRPFDARRKGTVFGEGAAFLVLESETRADCRGARPYARVAATGWSCDGHHLTAPEPGGAQIQLALLRALAQARVRPDEVACVIPHGTGTELNDVVESQALRAVFGGHCDDLPLYSAKAMLGHTAGAAGALAIATTALILRHGSIPPNPPSEEPDPRCPVWLPEQPRPLEGRYAMANAYAFGGNNVSVLLERIPI
jgi:3-oxoacyl-(acyl-carrier-protein) synthase